MSTTFAEGYALIVGVGADLPNTVGDAQGLAKILKDPERCAYPRKDHVDLLTQKRATRQSVLNAFDQLAAKTDKDSTIIIYFSGHGYQVASGKQADYYLMPYGYDVERLPQTAISGREFTEKIEAIAARKIMVLLDCCHAGGLYTIAASDGKTKAPAKFALSKSPLPPEARELLKKGDGRVFIASSKEDELSYAGNPYSAFTTSLIEALCGKGAAKEDGQVRVTDLAMYASQMVPRLTNDKQHPTLNFDAADNFTVSFYASGAKEPKALPKEIAKPQIQVSPGSADFKPADDFAARWQSIETQINNTGNIGFLNKDVKAERIYQAQGDMTFND